MFLIIALAFFGNAYQYQKAFNLCAEYNFELKGCDFHYNNILNNPKSIYYDQIQKQ